MRTNILPEGSSIWKQLFFLLAMIVIGFLIATVLAGFLSLGTWNLQSPWGMRLLQTVTSGLVFLLPALLFARFAGGRMSEYLQLRYLRDFRICAAVVAAMIVALPVINITAYLNSLLRLPAALAPLENWMRETEETAKLLMEGFFKDSGLAVYAANMIVIALCPGIYEEFFFRGVLQRIFVTGLRNVHVGIWLSAFIFGIIHLQFFGLLPRVLLGAYFGYLLYWTRNLWIPVIAHFINNALAVTGMSIAGIKDSSFVSGEMASGEVWIYVAATPVACLLLYYCSQYIRKAGKGAE
jgi:membrane protease YdiL (CAAX protease family)